MENLSKSLFSSFALNMWVIAFRENEKKIREWNDFDNTTDELKQLVDRRADLFTKINQLDREVAILLVTEESENVPRQYRFSRV